MLFPWNRVHRTPPRRHTRPNLAFFWCQNPSKLGNGWPQKCPKLHKRFAREDIEARTAVPPPPMNINTGKMYILRLRKKDTADYTYITPKKETTIKSMQNFKKLTWKRDFYGKWSLGLLECKEPLGGGWVDSSDQHERLKEEKKYASVLYHFYLISTFTFLILTKTQPENRVCVICVVVSKIEAIQ